MFSESLMDLWNLNICTICIMLNVQLKSQKIWFSVWLRALKIWITVWLMLLMMIDSTVAWIITYMDMILEDARNFVWNKHSMMKHLFSMIFEFPSVFYRSRYIFVWKYFIANTNTMTFTYSWMMPDNFYDDVEYIECFCAIRYILLWCKMFQYHARSLHRFLCELSWHDKISYCNISVDM